MIYLTSAPVATGAALYVRREVDSAFYTKPSADGTKMEAAVDPEMLGPRIPISEVSIGDFVLTVGKNRFVSGKVTAISRSGSGETTLELSQASRHGGSMGQVQVREPRAIFRTISKEVSHYQGWFERVVLRKPLRYYSAARTISEILNQPMEPASISLEDQGRSIVLPSRDDRVWTVRTIKTVTQSSSSLTIYFADEKWPDHLSSFQPTDHTILGIILR